MNGFRKYLLSSVARIPEGDAAAAAPVVAPAGGADAAPAIATETAAPAAAAATQLDAPSLLSEASGKKPDAKAAPEPAAPDAKGTDTKSSPTDVAKPAEGAAKVDAKTQDASSEAPAKADAKTDAKVEGDKPKPDAAKAQEPAKDEKAKEGEKPAEAAPPVPVAYDAFKVSDNVKLDEAKVKEFTDIIGPRQLPQEDAQKLVDLFDKSAQDLATHMRQEQRKTWNDLNDTWKTETRNDPEIGGNRFQTSLATAKAVIEEFLTPEQQKRYLGHLDLNGMSNFPEHIRLLANIGNALNVFEDKIVAPNAPNPSAGKSGGFRRNYKNSGNGAAT